MFRLLYNWQVLNAPRLPPGLQGNIGMINGFLTILSLGLIGVFYLYISRRRVRQYSSASKLDERVVADAVFLLNLLAILLFTSRSWHMNFVWMILPMTMLLSEFIQRAKLWFTISLGLSFALINAVIFEDPLLDSLNMIGGLLSLGLIAWFLLSPKLVIRIQGDRS
jgi:hypothetical protein